MDLSPICEKLVILDCTTMSSLENDIGQIGFLSHKVCMYVELL